MVFRRHLSTGDPLCAIHDSRPSRRPFERANFEETWMHYKMRIQKAKETLDSESESESRTQGKLSEATTTSTPQSSIHLRDALKKMTKKTKKLVMKSKAPALKASLRDDY